MRRMNGPMSFTANHDVGVLVDGFEHPPVVDMGHSRRWQGALAERSGLIREKDLFAWRYDVANGFNARTEGAWRKLADAPEVRLRSVRLRRMREELGLLCITVPNLNEAIADLRGHLWPFGWAKLLWRTKASHPKSARVILLGVREATRKNVKKYGFLSAAMYVEVAKRGAAKGYEWAELSWTREDDAPINLGIRSMGGRAYKTYRVYEKALAR
jgi:hypothetical protein